MKSYSTQYWNLPTGNRIHSTTKWASFLKEDLRPKGGEGKRRDLAFGLGTDRGGWGEERCAGGKAETTASHENKGKKRDGKGGSRFAWVEKGM